MEFADLSSRDLGWAIEVLDVENHQAPPRTAIILHSSSDREGDYQPGGTDSDV